MTLVVSFACELGPIITRYDFFEAMRVISSNVDITSLFVSFSYELGQILVLIRYDFLEVDK